MRWRKSFPSRHSTAITTAPGVLSLLFLALCSPVQLDLTESQLLETVCPVGSSSDIQAENLRYPVCLEEKWTVGALPPRATVSEQTAMSSATESSYTTSLEDKVKGMPTPTATATATATDSPAEADPDVDTESPLDNVNFLSFDEWKMQNLAKVGQSAENVGGKRPVPPGAEKRRHIQTEGINNALDALGDEGEIELEFGGFNAENEDLKTWGQRERKKDAAASAGAPDGRDQATRGTEGEVQLDGIPRRGAAPRKDAGVTCKERFNYASFDCAATVLKTNPQCTGSSSVLIENKDSYMLNECRAKEKFLILELCDDILVDTVVIANYEFFSSIFRTFKISVSDRYPAKQWREVGTYEAANTREVQAFAVENPLIWARYIKIDFLTHYGNEFYCPVSLVRVHGTTMMEEYKNEGETTRTEPEEEAVAIAEENVPVQEPEPEAPNLSPTGEARSEENISAPGVADSEEQNVLKPKHMGSDEAGVCLPEPGHLEVLFPDVTLGTCPVVVASHVAQNGTPTRPKAEAARSSEGEVDTPPPAPVNVTVSEAVSGPDATASNSTRPESSSQKSSQETRAAASTGVPKSESSTPVEPTRPQTATQQQAPPPPNPTTQESFFKSVHKRLQMLESNSSLSLLYIEEQSRILREAFSKVEKRQLSKTTNFLENLNNTVLSELRDFRQQYDHVWHSVTYQMEQQRLQYNRELFAVTAQLGVLAEELVFQKRISIIQSIFVLICFGVVLFSRSAVGAYLELPRVQSFVRSHSFRSGSASPSYDTPSASQRLHSHSHSPSHSYSKSMALHHQHQHQRSPSEESHPDDHDHDHDHGHASSCEPMMTFSGPSPPLSDVGSPRSETDEKMLSSEYPHSEVSGSSASNSVLLIPDQGEGSLRQRSSPPSLARGDSDGTDGGLLSPP